MLNLKREITFKNSAEVHSAELKAAMYAGGNLSKLVQMALKNYSIELPEYTKKEITFDWFHEQGRLEIKVLNVPCKGDQENLILTAKIETILAETLKDRLNHQDDEVVINFDDLIK